MPVQNEKLKTILLGTAQKLRQALETTGATLDTKISNTLSYLH